GREISEQKDYGDKIANEIDKEVNKIIEEAHKVAERILTENKPKLIQIAEKLIAQETLEGEELEPLFNQTTPKPTPKPISKPMPIPAEATVKVKPVPKQAPAIPQPLPKQAPATPD
ncbi:unnamed protein product, partial [marine sediment metagenome]